jgi:polyisoprenoid-binding protein YceI
MKRTASLDCPRRGRASFSGVLLLVGALNAVTGCSGPRPVCVTPGRDQQQVVAASQTQPPTAGIYAIDPVHTFVGFAAQHKVVGRVDGRFDKTTGTVTIATDPAAVSADVSIEAASITTQNSMRDDDLRGPDFFDAAKFPAIEYRGRGIRKAEDAWSLDGSLTIRGVSKSVPLSISFRGTAPAQPGKPSRVAFHATAAVKRADFGMTRELLDEIGAISDAPDVWISIDAELLAGAPKQP